MTILNMVPALFEVPVLNSRLTAPRTISSTVVHEPLSSSDEEVMSAVDREVVHDLRSDFQAELLERATNARNTPDVRTKPELASCHPAKSLNEEEVPWGCLN